MKRVVRYFDEFDVVMVYSTGEYRLSGEMDTLQRVRDELSNNDCHKCIFDVRDSQVVADTMSVYKRPDAYSDLGLPRTTRIAILLNCICDDLKFYETVCLNRGWDVRVFDDIDSATNWLGIDAATRCSTTNTERFMQKLKRISLPSRLDLSILPAFAT